MRAPYQILMPLFSLFLVRVDLTDLKALEMKVNILKVYDGDTVLVGKWGYKFRVRISKIDAPESAQDYLNGKKGAGELSQRCLTRLLKNKAVLTIEGFDMYGRVLGDVDRVSLKLIEEGCASLYPYARFSGLSEKYLYVKKYFEARRLKRGLWASGGIMQPRIWRKKNKGIRKRALLRP